MSSSRQIGVAFEREIARRFQRWFLNARRGLQYQAGEHCPDIIETPFYVECKRGKKYLWDGHTSVRPHKEADMAWLYGNVSDKAEQWDDDWEFVIIVWKLTDKKYCNGRKHIVMVSMALKHWWELKCGAPSALDDRICIGSWEKFAEVLDKRYEVKG